MKQAGIISTGSYLPKKIVTNFDLEKMVDTSNEWIVSRTGIEQRHIANDGETTSDLAVQAAFKALDNAEIHANELDLIIVATLTPDTLMPSTATQVQKKLKATNAAAFDISAACSGFVYALTIARQFINSGEYRYILVIGAETLTKFVDWQDRNTCVLFGDGAGAAIVSQVNSGSGIFASYIGADGAPPYQWLTIEGGGSLMPPTNQTVQNRAHYIKMNGKEIFKFGCHIIVEAVEKVLEKAGLNLADVDYIIPHQANIRIIESAAKKLNFPLEKFIVNIDQCANTSAASIPIALDQAYQKGMIQKEDLLVLVGFGSGFTWGSVAIKI